MQSILQIKSMKTMLYVFNNRSEFGPGLGARSIIANPTIKNIVEILNTKIKLREPFRPFSFMFETVCF